MSPGEDRQMKMSVSEPTVMAGAVKSSAFHFSNFGEAVVSNEEQARPLYQFMLEGANSTNSRPDEGQNFAGKSENSGAALIRGTNQSYNRKQTSVEDQHPQAQLDLPNFLSNTPFSGNKTLRSDAHHKGYSENPFANTTAGCDNSNRKNLYEDVARLDQSRQDIDTTTVDYPSHINPNHISILSSTPKTTNTSVSERFESITLYNGDYSATRPGGEMGYANLGYSTGWSVPQSSIKMERSEAKDDEFVSSSASITSPALSPAREPMHLGVAHVEPLPAGGRLLSTAVGTPSTVSTAPSTDDASFEHLADATNYDKLSLGLEEANFGRLQPRPVHYTGTTIPLEGARNRTSHHRRANSWDDGSAIGGGARLGTSTIQNGIHNRSSRPPRITGPYGPSSSRHGHVDSWTGLPPSNYRNEQMMDANSTHTFQPRPEPWRQHQRNQPYFLGQHQQGQHMQLPPSGAFHGRKNGPLPTTPPRGRNGRPLQPPHRQSNPSVPTAGGTGTNPPRSSSEVLKTLLRKKACLYEPETSRAVALVTWLVGRELALAYGYFSRQQLQSGVHACVAKKIDAGSITRTKVNRCMQIILNSCFHYIIPRPDGSEENGESFQAWFAEHTKNDSDICRTLYAPWNDIVVDRDVVLSMASHELDGKNSEKRHHHSITSPHSSPRLSSVEAPSHFHDDVSDHGSKRAVLLCFNENVRSADDVLRCHNEFIRDTANAAKLQLTAQEWRAFFGRDGADSSAWGSAISKHEQSQDYLGHMKESDLFKFRTSWCAKRYDHDHELCGFAHFEVNGGWLRRNPSFHRYRNEMCSSIICIPDENTGLDQFSLNQCAEGVDCSLCHSKEELLYHPNNYKVHVCKATSSHGQQCRFGDICPNLHPRGSHHPAKKSPNDTRHSGQQRHGNRQGHHTNFSGGSQGRGVTHIPPPGAPMLYVHPAPFSSFDRHLVMPGLQNLFRRQSAVVQASLKENAGRVIYSNFGDEREVSRDSTVYGSSQEAHGSHGSTVRGIFS